MQTPAITRRRGPAGWRRWAWPLAKAVLAAAILFFIGRQFALNLGQLEGTELTLRPGWLLLSCLLYLTALSFSALFWFQLLRVFGQRPALTATVRAYYLGHLGKYVPGKAWALLMRGNLVRGPGVRPSIAIITSFYEVLTTMASGALLAAVLFAVEPPRLVAEQLLHPALLGGLLLALVGVPLLPVVFNTMVRRLAARSQAVENMDLPRLRTPLLLQGLALTGMGWVLLGLSLWAMIQALVPEPIGLTARELARYVAMMGLSYVAGFLAFMLPSGVGVREGVLETFLAAELAGQVVSGKGVATVVVIVLRLAWTGAELAMAAAVYSAEHARATMNEGGFVISLVIPVYNEKDSLAALHAEIVEAAGKAQLAYEILFVDDGSRDGSWPIIADLAREHPEVHGIRFRRNFGKAAALSAGFSAARGQIILTLDADLQDDPAEIPRFLAALAEDKDVVSGWKRRRFDPWHKVFPSRIFNGMVSWVTGVKLHDHNCGMKCYRADIFREVRLYGELHRFIPVLAAARGFKVSEIEINHRPRRFGHSKYGVRRFVKGFLDLLTVKFLTGFGQRPQHMLGTIGLVSFFGGLLGMAYLTLTWFVRLFEPTWFEPLHTRPLLLYSVAALLLGAQMMSIGFLAELMTAYLSKTEETFSVAEQTPDIWHRSRPAEPIPTNVTETP